MERKKSHSYKYVNKNNFVLKTFSLFCINNTHTIVAESLSYDETVKLELWPIDAFTISSKIRLYNNPDSCSYNEKKKKYTSSS